MADQGTFYGLGVGPGDPELLTLRAHRLIGQAGLVAYPAAGDGASLARRIAAGAIVPGTEELAIAVPMCTERAPARTAYDEAARTIARHLADGRDVVFLCEGDPFLYGSFMYLFERLSAAHRCEAVPGVTSLTACAAALGRPLAARNDVLTVIPATLPEERLRAALDATDAAAIVKVGRHFDKVRSALDATGLAGCAMIVEAATTEDEKITALTDMPEGERPYFSTILVYRGGEAW